ATTARHGLATAESPVRREKREFAHVVAEHLNEAAKRGAYHKLVIAAPPKFLGDIRAALDSHAGALVVHEIAKDLTKESDPELSRRIAEIVYPGAGA
ncbi:MAG: host attachment protein, partial [Rhodospirillaceae bacterium]|nr:host attachment protein [Rhodospirillaceae bacterium]